MRRLLAVLAACLPWACSAPAEEGRKPLTIGATKGHPNEQRFFDWTELQHSAQVHAARRERMHKRTKCDQNQTPSALRRIRSDVEQSRTGV